MTGYCYETIEWSFGAPAPAGSQAQTDLRAGISLAGDTKEIKGFYAGNNTWKLRFLPESEGTLTAQIRGVVNEDITMQIGPAKKDNHGIVKAQGTHLYYEDGTPFYSFGTTVYALAHQSDELMDETIETLRNAPFNKVRMCLFPKHYDYNHNDPQYYAFEKDEEGNWDPDRPCFAFWDAFEDKLHRLFDAGIQVDLILFHPYDRWGFASMPLKDNLVYLDYLLRRFSAYANIWWSMANEYDLVFGRSMEDWYALEEFVAQNDPYHHLLSSHNCFKMYDADRPNVTHVSWQTKQFRRIPEMMSRFNKPVLVDECCYEGNLEHSWGAISGKEMTARFWRTTSVGGYCTHGETFLPGEDEVVWWARGGKLVGESPARIAFLRSITESLPGPLSPAGDHLSNLIAAEQGELTADLTGVPESARNFAGAILRMGSEEAQRFFSCEISYNGRCGEDDAFLYYYDVQTHGKVILNLPETRSYRIEVIDTWNMTRETVRTGASGTVTIPMPGREYMAVLAVAEQF